MEKKPVFHGSDLELIEQYYGIPKEEIVSFSANVNPLGISPKFRESLREHIDTITAYPDREYKELRQAISGYCGAPVEQILPGSGATDLISRFIRLIRPRRAMLVEPTYSEYAREITLAGGEIASFALREDEEFRLSVPRLCGALDDSFDLLILCNPNNPTGSAVRQDELRAILSHCQKRGIYVLIDETYVEFAAEMEDITAVRLAAEFDNLLVLRGTSKFFASPGLRLGYAVCGSSRIRDALNDKKIPWGINSYAAVCGAEMFRDTAYIQATRDFTDRERRRLVGILRDIPELQVFSPSANFILLRIRTPGVTSAQVFEHAIRDGLMLRDCSTFPGLGDSHIRFCFCLPEQNDRLIQKILETVRR